MPCYDHEASKSWAYAGCIKAEVSGKFAFSARIVRFLEDVTAAELEILKRYASQLSDASIATGPIAPDLEEALFYRDAPALAEALLQHGFLRRQTTEFDLEELFQDVIVTAGEPPPLPMLATSLQMTSLPTLRTLLIALELT